METTEIAKIQKKPQKDKQQKLSKAVFEEVVRVASIEAVRAYKAEADAASSGLKDKRLHNAKLLVKKYRWLCEYNRSAVYDTAQLCADGMDEVLEMMGVDVGERYQVGSIRNSVVVTRIIMEHIDTMIGCYKLKCLESKKPEIRRRWRVLEMMYVGQEAKTAQDVADLEHISVSMVYADIDSACEELSSLFFGLDLSEFWS